MPEKLGARTKLAYGLGDFGLSVSYTIIGLFFLFFLTDVAGVSPALAGGAMLIGRFWDAVTDPVCGHLSDRTTTRWGRRRPYFLFAALPFGLTFFAMWLVPPAAGEWARFGVGALAFVLHMTAYTLISVPYNSLTAELTPDYDERTSLTAYRMAFSIIGGFVGAVVPMTMVHACGSPRAGFAVMGAVFGAVGMLTPFAVFFGCREEYRPPVPGPLPVAESLRMTLANRPFRIALAVYLLTWISMDLISAVFVYFLKYWLNMEAGMSLVLALVFGTAIAFLPFWVAVSRRTSKRAAYIGGMGLLSLILMGVVFLGARHRLIMYILAPFAGMGIAAAQVIPWSMIPDCIEYDELLTGARREGAYYGFTTFLQKLASSVAVFLTGATLEWAGYTAGVAQSAKALWAIRILLGPVPGLLFLAAALLLSFYPLSREEHARLRATIEARRPGGGREKGSS